MSAATLVNLLTIAGLVAIMLSMGFNVSFAEVAAPIRKPRLVVSSLLANFVLAPIATAALLYLFDANPLVSVGFLILAVCPGAPLGPPFTAVAKGVHRGRKPRRTRDAAGGKTSSCQGTTSREARGFR